MVDGSMVGLSMVDGSMVDGSMVGLSTRSVPIKIRINTSTLPKTPLALPEICVKLGIFSRCFV